MSSPPAKKSGSPPQQGPSSDCAIEAAKLLNCVAAKTYSKEECVAALDALRACVRKHVSSAPGRPPCRHARCSPRAPPVQHVVDFTLLPEEPAAPKKE